MVDTMQEVIDVTLDSNDNNVNDIDLSFLEAKELNDDFFAIESDYFKSLSQVSTKPAFVPTLHDAVFEPPLNHALWNCDSWPEPTRHFPS